MSLSLLYFRDNVIQMQWSIFIPQSDVTDTGSFRPSARFHFEMPKMVLKAAKAKACATKIQFAIWSRSGACRLDRSSVSGFDTPVSRSNPEGGMFLWEFATQPAANYLDGFQDFFSQVTFWL